MIKDVLLRDLTDYEKILVTQAREARLTACAPHSNFLVGSAALDERGTIFVGANVEDDSYPMTLCSEPVSLSRLAMGGGKVTKICVILEGGSQPGGSPCGGCRQRIWTRSGHNPDTVIIMGEPEGESFRISNIGYMLPDGFVLKH